VLHQGQILKEGTVAEIRADPEVTAVYLGRADEDAELAEAEGFTK
jgi:urea transport system ATP-binding protein